MLRRLLIVFGLLVGLLALADRGLAVLAGNAVGSAVQKSEQLPERPDVRFRGFPFLTQAVRGRFEAVEVTVRDLRRDGLTVTRVDARLEGVQVSLSRALSGEVTAVPIRRGTATVSLSYADLNEFLRSRPGDPQVSSAGGRLTVRSSVGVPGRGQVPVEGQAEISLSGDVLGVRVSNPRTTAGTLPVAAQVEATRRLSFSIPLRGLPFGIRLRGVTASPEALSISAEAQGVVIRAR